MGYSTFGADRRRLYVPFIMAFLVFSAVLAVEYLIVSELLDDIYRRQTQQYHSILRRIPVAVGEYSDSISRTPEELERFAGVLARTAGLTDFSARIFPDHEAFAVYSDSVGGSESTLDAEFLDKGVIETSLAKLPNGFLMVLNAAEYNDTNIKYLQDIQIGLIIVSFIMVIIALVPGALMIESLARRRRMPWAVSYSRGEGVWKNAASMLSDSTVMGFMMVSTGGDVLWTNGKCREMLDIAEDSRTISLASVTSLPDRIRKRTDAWPREPVREQVTVRSISGGQRTLSLEMLPDTRSGESRTVLMSFIDPAEENFLRSGQGALASAETLPGPPVAAKELARSMIHEINNHLSGILGSASLELDRNADGRYPDSWRAVLESAEKISGTCSELQSLLSGDPDRVLKAPMDELNPISEVMRRILPEGVTFKVTGGTERLITLRRETLRDLIYNLALNSTGMMNGDGRIRIDVSERIPAGIGKPGYMPPGNGVCIRYSDGYIMPVALRDVLSARNYPVSDVEREFGTTVGNLYRALRDIDGEVTFERGSGETVLCLVLQGFEGPETGTAGDPIHTGQSGISGLRVLVADEVEIVRLSTAEFLEHRGMSVSMASDGDRAMELLRSGRFDAAVLDLNMPGVPTTSIVRYCQTSLPGMAVVITTGYGMNARLGDLIRHPSTDCLHKPHRPEVLVETIHSTISTIRNGEHT